MTNDCLYSDVVTDGSDSVTDTRLERIEAEYLTPTERGSWAGVGKRQLNENAARQRRLARLRMRGW